MAFPPPSPGVQTATIYPEIHRSPTRNELRVYALGLPALRRVRVVMMVSPMTNQLRYPGDWRANCRCAVKYPRRDLAPVGAGASATTELHLAPSSITIPSPGAPVMSVLDVYLPRQPQVESVTILFSAENEVPAAQTYVMGYPDSQPHDYDGLFLPPFGSGNFVRRPPGDSAEDVLELDDDRQERLKKRATRQRRSG